MDTSNKIGYGLILLIIFLYMIFKFANQKSSQELMFGSVENGKIKCLPQNLHIVSMSVHINYDLKSFSDVVTMNQGSLCVCAQPMGDDII